MRSLQIPTHAAGLATTRLLHLPKATRFVRSATAGVGTFIGEPELSGMVQLLDGAYERARILLRILGNRRVEAEMVGGSEAVGREVDEAGPQIRMPDTRGQASSGPSSTGGVGS